MSLGIHLNSEASIGRIESVTPTHAMYINLSGEGFIYKAGMKEAPKKFYLTKERLLNTLEKTFVYLATKHHELVEKNYGDNK